MGEKIQKEKSEINPKTKPLKSNPGLFSEYNKFDLTFGY